MALREILAHFGFTFDKNKLQEADKGIDKVKTNAIGIGDTLKGAAGALAGVFGVEIIRGWVSEIIEAGDSLGDFAAQVSMGTDEIQELRYAGERSGIAAEKLDAGLVKLRATLAKSDPGLTAQLKDLGVEAKDAEGNLKGPAEFLSDLANNIGDLNSSERVELVTKLFGKSGQQFLPLLERGAEGVEELRKRFQELGGGFSAEAIEAAGEMDDALVDWKYAAMGAKAAFAVSLLPAITRLVTWITRAVGWFNRWEGKAQFLRAMLIGIGVVGVKAFSNMLGPLGKLLKMSLRTVLPWAALILILDELWTTFNDGDSVIRDVIDGAFGQGTTKQITDWIKGVIEDVKWFWNGITEGGQEFEDDMAIVAGGIQQTWENSLDALSAAFETYGLVGRMAFASIVNAAYMAAAQIQDAFAGAWNQILLTASSKIVDIASALASVPGMQDTAKKVALAGVGLMGGIKSQGNVAAEQGRQLAEATMFGAEASALSSRMSKFGTDAGFAASARPTESTENNTVNVYMPPGTKPTDAAAVGRAVGREVSGKRRAAIAKLEPVGG